MAQTKVGRGGAPLRCVDGRLCSRLVQVGRARRHAGGRAAAAASCTRRPLPTSRCAGPEEMQDEVRPARPASGHEPAQHDAAGFLSACAAAQVVEYLGDGQIAPTRHQGIDRQAPGAGAARRGAGDDEHVTAPPRQPRGKDEAPFLLEVAVEGQDRRRDVRRSDQCSGRRGSPGHSGRHGRSDRHRSSGRTGGGREVSRTGGASEPAQQGHGWHACVFSLQPALDGPSRADQPAHDTRSLALGERQWLGWMMHAEELHRLVPGYPLGHASCQRGPVACLGRARGRRV